MPFGVFWILFRAMPANLAFERLSMTRAMLNAIASAFSKEGAGLPEGMKLDLRDAALPREQED